MIIYEHLKAIAYKLKSGDIERFQQPFIWGDRSNNIEVIVARQIESGLRENSEKQEGGQLRKVIETYNLTVRFE